MEAHSKKYVIKQLINTNLNDGLDLSKVITNIKIKFECDLSEQDVLYIEHKYVKRLVTKWLQQAPEQTVRSIGSDQFADLLKQLGSVKSFYDCSLCSYKSGFILLILKLYDESPRLRTLEEMSVLQFKQACLNLIKFHVEKIVKVDNFVSKFVSVLKNTLNLKQLCYLLKFEDFIKGTITYEDFIRNLLDVSTSTKDIKLKQVCEIVMNPVDCISLRDNLIEIINTFLKPVIFKQSVVDGRAILEVIGTYIVLSEELVNIESITNFDQIDEIRIVNASILHADINLKNSVWHGKNLIISSETIIVSNKGVIWDVSGVNGEELHPLGAEARIRDAGSKPGESGGNVLIMVDSVEGETLTIVSNGGNGSKGLDGIPGIDGEDGDFIDGLTFNDMFPRPSLFFNSNKVTNLKLNKDSIFKKLNQVLTFYINEIEIKNIDVSSLSDWLSQDSLSDFYIKGKTKTGCEITFSFYCSGLFSRCQSYLLYKGAPGNEGTPGGIAGLGGCAGFAGNIDVHISGKTGNVTCMQNNGQPGTCGKQGPTGKPGISGTDCGYMDVSLSYDWPKLFLTHPDDDKTLIIEYFSDNSSDRVYCPYKKQYAKIKDTGKKLKKVSQQYVSTFRSNLPNHNLQQGTRKKTIHLKSMMDQYKRNTVSGLDQLQYSVETEINTVNELIDKDLQMDKIIDESKMTRMVSHIFKTGIRRNTISEDSSINKLELNVYSIKDSKNKYQGIKYKLKILNKIEFEYFREAHFKIEFTNNLKFYNGNYDIILSVNNHHHDFVSDYFCLDSIESRKHVEMLFCNSYRNDFIETFLSYITSFNICDSQSKLNKHVIMEILSSIILLLEHQDLSKLYKQMCKCILEEDSKSFQNVLTKISQIQFLRELYKHYQFECRKKHDWIINDDVEENLRACICEGIIYHGPFSGIYREFLSHHFNKNIVFYSLDERKQIKLISNHNPLAESKHHILLKENKFYDLSVNVDLAELLHYHKVRGSLYSKILSHIDSLPDKNYIDQFANNSPFKYSIYKGIEKSIASYVKLIQIISQDKDIKIIKSHFNAVDDKLISPRLEKLKVEYIGYTNTLHYMALHFENDGISISTKEFCCVLNFILGSALALPSSVPVISWIIASSPPTHWLIECTILKLEIYLNTIVNNETKNMWREYMSSQSEKSRLIAFFQKICEDNNSKMSVESIDELLNLLSCTPQAHVGLELIDLKHWKYYLKDKYWMHQLKMNTSWPEDIVNQASLHFTVMDNYKGFEQAKKVLKIFINHANKVENNFDTNLILDLLRDLSKNEICLNDGFLEILLTATIKDWGSKLEEARFNLGNERSIRQLVELVNTCGNTSENVKHNLSSIEELVEKVNMKKNKMYVKLSKEDLRKQWIHCILQLSKNKNEQQWKVLTKVDNNFIDIMVSIFSNIFNKASESASIREKIMNDYDEVIMAIIIIIIKDKLQIELRNTQKLSIMMFLKNKGNLLAQVSTGEGKSLIVVCVAIIKAITGQKVDIITSSHVLAERDAKEYSEVYKVFGLHVGHNCYDNLEKRKQIYSNCQIVYGELSNFQRDFLLDRVYDKNILGDRDFETILVDEVDSLLLDRGNNTLYLSHEIPGLDKLESLFVYIWKWFNTPSGRSALELKEDILIGLDHINKNSLKELDSNLNETAIHGIWKVLVNEGIINENGIMVKEQIDYGMLDSKTKNYIHIRHLQYLLNKVFSREKQFVIPNYLKCFAYRHLDKWIRSAQMAMHMENGKHYVVDVDRSNTRSDRSPNVTILDGDTGTDLASSQWENGLHQFLQLKHGCKMFSISLKAVFISNISFIQKYKSLFGLSGTLGTSMERTLLINLYDVGYVTIPTAKEKLFCEIPPITFKDKHNWAKGIFNSVFKIAITRSVLIICESVNDVMFLKNQFNKLMNDNTSKCHIKVHTYTRDYEKLNIADYLEQSQIIISTNLAGRGTDIKLSEELIQAGGLHVCLSFLPNNSRVEEQAYGRVARKGQSGTAQMIFISECENSISSIVHLKKQRDLDEINRITNIEHIYQTQILAEEKHFRDFQDKYVELRSNNCPKNVKQLLLQVCLDKWALWLDEHVDSLTSASNSDFINDIANVFRTNFNEDPNCIKDPFHLTKLGFIYLLEPDYEKSIFLFDKVIREEKNFSEAALYYRIYAKAAMNDHDSSMIPDLLNDFIMVEQILEKHISSSIMSGCFIDWLKHHNANSIIQNDSYKKQQQQRCDILNLFLLSIYQITGQEIMPSDMLTLASSEKDLNNLFTSYRVYYKCMTNGIVKQPQLKSFQEEDLTFALHYGIKPSKIGEFLTSNETIIGSAFMKYNFFNVSNNEKVVKFWKKLKQFFPSRELFWNSLLAKNALECEVKYLFIDINRLGQEMPYLSGVINNLKEDEPPFNKNTIWLYKKNEIIIPNCNLVIVKKNKLLSIVGIEIYMFLKKHGIIHHNKQAYIGHRWNEALPFENFDSLIESDFDNIGIHSEDAKTIIAELEEKNIIEKDNTNYSLVSNEKEIKKIRLSRNPAYTSDVISLLLHCFSFRIAYQKLNDLICEPGLDRIHLFLPLQPHLHKLFFSELQEKLLTKPKVNPKIDIGLKELYSRSMNMDQWVEKFNIFFNKCYSLEIIESLIESKWLLYNNNNSNFYVNCTKAVGADNCYSNYILIKPEGLPYHLNGYNELIEYVLLDYLHLIDNVESIENVLKEKVGKIYSKVIPGFHFKPLLSVLIETHKPTSECQTFSLNGFDNIMFVKEKTFTFKMKVQVSIVATLGIAEIAAGAVLMTCYSGIGEVAGEFLLSEGIADLIFCISCLNSGCFNDYMKLKLNSLVVSAASSCIKFVTLFKSNYGSRSAGFKFKDIIKHIKGQGVMKPSFSNVVVKRVITICSSAVYVAAERSIISQVIEQQLDKMGEALITIIHSNIDRTIVDHEVIQCLKNFYVRFGENETKKHCNDCFQNAVNEYKYNHNNLRNVFSLCKTVIQGCFTISNSNEQEKSKLVLQVIGDFIKLMSSSQICWSQITTLVADILNAFQYNLESVCNDNPHVISHSIKDNDCNYFISSLMEDWKKEIKSVFSDGIDENILTPLFLFTSERLHSELSYYPFENYSFFTDDEIQEMSKSKLQQKNWEEFNEQDLFQEDNFIESQYNSLLFSLLYVVKDISLLTEISKRNLPVDMNCIEMCCQIIPMIFRKVGIEIDPFEIVIDIKGVSKRYKSSPDESSFTTIYLTNTSLLNNDLNNRSVCVKDVVYTIVKALCPKISPNLNDLLRQILGEAETNKSIFGLSQITYSGSSIEHINNEHENRLAYQHKYWKFKPSVDIDLRGKDILHSETIEDYVHKGFGVAVEKINQFISVILLGAKRSIKLCLQDFIVLKHEIWPQSTLYADIPFHCQAVHYELVLPLPIECEDTVWEFLITISLITKVDKRAGSGPLGPHIVYEVCPLSRTRFLDVSVRGHVLLNSDCCHVTHKPNHCYVAGELILPTGFKYPDETKQNETKM